MSMYLLGEAYRDAENFRVDRENALNRVKKLEQRVEELKATLKPFAAMADTLEHYVTGGDTEKCGGFFFSPAALKDKVRVYLRDVRAARAALKVSPDD